MLGVASRTLLMHLVLTLWACLGTPRSAALLIQECHLNLVIREHRTTLPWRKRCRRARLPLSCGHIQAELLHNGGELLPLLRHGLFQRRTPGLRLFHGACYVSGLPLCFKPLADEVPGQSLITRLETEIDVVVDLPCCPPHLLLLCGQPLQRRVQRSKGLLLVRQGLLHVPYGLFHDFLGVFEAIKEAVEV